MELPEKASVVLSCFGFTTSSVYMKTIRSCFVGLEFFVVKIANFLIMIELRKSHFVFGFRIVNSYWQRAQVLLRRPMRVGAGKRRDASSFSLVEHLLVDGRSGCSVVCACLLQTRE